MAEAAKPFFLTLVLTNVEKGYASTSGSGFGFSYQITSYLRERTYNLEVYYSISLLEN